MALRVHLLACALGLGSWVAVNGLWVELPLLVNALPEGWELPSYLTVLIQTANLGPLLIALAHKAAPGRLKERPVILAVLCVGVLSCVLLTLFWDRTSVVAGARRSVAFFVITFFLSLVDCTSSVTFLPFMTALPAAYVASYYVGEGLSGFLPGVVALAQGVGAAKCVNATQGPAGNHSGAHDGFLQTEYLPPNFSTEVFFFFLTAMMCVSLAAFVALCRLRPDSDENPTGGSPGSGPDDPAAEIDLKRRDEGGADSRYRLTFIYFLVVWVNGATNGALPSVQTYSCMPYGNLAYHLSAALASMANPLACTVAMFFQNRSVVFLGALALLGTAFGSYNMAMAAMSPCPLLQGSVAGEVVIVLSWLLFTGTLSYVKVMVGVILRDRSHSALVWCGAAAQAGSLVGSVVMFPLVNVLKLFKAGDFCNTQCPL
ncbi:LOW QUALITY PROTEIN: solute carrier family 52, riboflavin transporter, member 3-A [Hippocampus zosterae]|uniref:LOW QUALITY PROTEIN: solute carrier family 52, riboflavin transporter, member 3-A n=1 Tax=Hippocampus zosterae TaxID=109293 RepID=UPI00223DA102|nr:LOW QUALITY PROTEIN: solute carrier family 52, riboflavin transporter, member 3-A [Hippocampus zosterae]